MFPRPDRGDFVQSTVACALEQHLLHLKKFTYRLDGDNVRFGLNQDLGFDEKSRNENIRRIGEVRYAVCYTVPHLLIESFTGLKTFRGLLLHRPHGLYLAVPRRPRHRAPAAREGRARIRRSVHRRAVARGGGPRSQRPVQESTRRRNQGYATTLLTR